MNEKKNIDRLFQEKFKDFEVTPPDFVWQNLEAGLQEKKKKRRILPLWFRLSGVAALLVIGMFATLPFINDDGGGNPNPVVLDTKEVNPDGSPRITPTDAPVRQSQSVETAVAADEKKPGKVVEQQKRGIHATVPGETTDEAIAEGGYNPVQRPDKKGSRKTGTDKINAPVTTTDAAVAQNNGAGREQNKPNRSGGNKTEGIKENTINGAKQDMVTGINKEEPIAVTEKQEAGNKETQGITGGEGMIRNPDGTAAIEINKNEALANTDVIADTATTLLPENELESLYQKKLKGEDKDENAVAEAHKNKWNIKPQMAPLFFNTASEGSPINTNLAANGKDFDNDLSYGVGVNYALTDKITIRSGINTVNMRYATNDVQYHATLASADNIGFASTNVTAPSGPSANLVIGPPETTSATGTGMSSQSFDGSLVQKMGFVEVPLEMSYKLVNKRFGVDIIGGVSTLFLNDNNVSLISEQGFRSNMGEATNLNNISFSTNVGIGFKYRIFDSFEANFEPMLKYQLNTFSSDAGNFKPYFIGLYSGISFSF